MRKIFLTPRSCCVVTVAFILLSGCNPVNRQPEKRISVSDTLQSTEAVNPYAVTDRSPMDQSYFPHDYPILKMNGADSSSLIARVLYSRPHKIGRTIFGTAKGSLCEYGREWRLGANEATELEFFRDVIINGKTIRRGRYIIYCIPNPEQWTIILNTNLYTWGLHMDKTKDIFVVNVPVEIQAPPLEDFTMVFEAASYGTNLVMAWDNVKATLRISTKIP